MLQQLKAARQEYPRQFWLMFYGMLISTTGSSMIWPFLMIYVSERLQLPLATAASLMTLSSVMGLISSFIAGPIVDRMGRKWAMGLSLLLNALGYLFMSRANTLPMFAAVMALNGAVNPLYRVGSDAMMADLVPPEKRADAYSLMRMSNNVGVALGPSIGGFIAAASYGLAFYFAASGMSIYSLLIALFARETLPSLAARRGGTPDSPRSGEQREIRRGWFAIGRRSGGSAGGEEGERFGGYGAIFADRPFMAFIGTITLVTICAALVWTLMAVYAKHNFGVRESQYGLIPTTNALMVVFLQIFVTRITKKHRPLRVMALGGLLYGLAVGGAALAAGFWGFWVVMVAMTFGELVLVPTSSTYAANMAPPDKRGRYMSLYGLTWGVASGIGPIFGGLLNDNLGPRAPWIGGGLVGLCGAVGFMMLAQPAGGQSEPAVLEN